MKINVERSFLEINSVKDLNSSKSPGSNYKIMQLVEIIILKDVGKEKLSYVSNIISLIFKETSRVLRTK